MLWQAAGSAATLAAALWVSTRMGLIAQGEFDLARRWFDAAAVVAAMGRPQGLLHLQYRLSVPADALWRWLARQWMLAVPVCLAGACVCAWADWTLAAAVIASLPMTVGHLMARSLLLPERGVVIFGFVSALPALVVLAGVGLLDVFDASLNFPLMILVALWLAGAVGLALCARKVSSDVPAFDSGALWAPSLQSWMQAALGGLLPAGLLSVVSASGHGGAALGAASIGLHAYQLLAVLAGYSAPVLFDHLARQDRPELAAGWVPRRMRLAVLLLLGLCGLGALLASQGHAPGWLLPLGLLLPAGCAAVAARVHGTVLLARGDYRELSLQAAWRLALGLSLLWVSLQWWPAPAALACTLLTVEVLTWWRSRVRAGREVSP